MSGQEGDPRERRRAARIRVDVPVRARLADGEPVPGRIANISEFGLFVALEDGVAGGAGDRITIELLPAGEVPVGRIEGKVVWRAAASASGPGGVGVQVTRVDREWIGLCERLRDGG